MVLSGTPASSTPKTGRHDIAENGVKTQNSKSNKSYFNFVILHLFKCVALLCVYIIVIIIL